MTPSELVILGSLMLLANTVEAMAGFGSTVLTLTLGAAWFDIGGLIPYLLPLNLLLSSSIVVRHWRHVDRPTLLRWVLPLMGLGVMVGLGLLQVLQAKSLETLFGAFVVGIAVFELVNMARRPADHKPQALGTTGSVLWLLGGGLIQGMYASGGPMLVYYGSRKFADKGAFRATLSATWLVLNTLMTVVFVAQGKINTQVLYTDLWLILPVLMGMVIGDKLHHRIDERTFRKGVFVLLAIAGSSIVVRSF